MLAYCHMPNRYRDWLEQAEHDLEHATEARFAGRHDWACFAAQQAAEKAAKALHLALGQEAWGHVVARLLAALPAEQAASEDLVDAARSLDNFYIPARYPNGHAEGPAFEHFGSHQSEQALLHARQIIAFVRSHLA
jgi:HEPN domain-containing protein